MDAETEAFIQAFHNHLICNHILTQAVMDGMKESGYGRIINIISTSVKQPLDGLGSIKHDSWSSCQLGKNNGQ